MALRVFLGGHFVGLVVPHPTGVTYDVQAGCVGIYQPKVEGFLVPLRWGGDEAMWREGALHCYHGDLAREGEWADKLREEARQIVAATGEREDCKLALDESRLSDGCEAWVPVLVAEAEHEQGLIGLLAWLTWPNCD